MLTMRQKMQRLSYGDDDVDTTTVNITEGNIIQRTERHARRGPAHKEILSCNFFLCHFFGLYL